MHNAVCAVCFVIVAYFLACVLVNVDIFCFRAIDVKIFLFYIGNNIVTSGKYIFYTGNKIVYSRNYMFSFGKYFVSNRKHFKTIKNEHIKVISK